MLGNGGQNRMGLNSVLYRQTVDIAVYILSTFRRDATYIHIQKSYKGRTYYIKVPLLHVARQLGHVRQPLASGHLREHACAHVGHDRHAVLVELQPRREVLDDVCGRLAVLLHVEHEFHQSVLNVTTIV